LYHPDVNATPGAAERMRAINAAYAVLSDPRRRAIYDARRYLPRQTSLIPPATPSQRTYVTVSSAPPTKLQRGVDRSVAGLGVVLLLAIGYYVLALIVVQPTLRASARAPTIAGTPSDAHPTSGGVPARLRADATLRDFPGTVLVAPDRLAPFADLAIQRVDA